MTQQLVDDVVAAGGSLRLPRQHWYDRDGINYERRAQLAERYRKVPSGKRLAVSPIDDELEIKLVDAPERGDPPELLPVPIPDKVSRYHQAARQFRDRKERHEVSKESLPRATRIIHAVAVEAERRGWSAQAPTESENGYGRMTWTATKDGHLQITAEDHGLLLRLREDGVRTRGPWEEEVRRYERLRDLAWYRDRKVPSGPYDTDATGVLKLELSFDEWSFQGRQSRWSDRQSWRLEDRLPRLFREIEERLIESKRVAEERRVRAQEAAEDAKRQAEERERRWHVLMDQAKRQLIEAHRAEHLHEQTDAWHEAEQIRRYCDAVEAAHGQHPDTAEWIAWARSHAAVLDPLAKPPSAPPSPEATPEALQKYLPEGWSALGPRSLHQYR